MNPGIALIPLASITLAPEGDGCPAVTDTIFPARTTIDPRSMTEALGPMMRTLVIVRSWAAAVVAASSVTHSVVSVRRPTSFLREQCRPGLAL